MSVSWSTTSKLPSPSSSSSAWSSTVARHLSRATGRTASSDWMTFASRLHSCGPPDCHGRLELTKFHNPTATTAELNAPANTFGLRRIMFAVDDIDDVIARMRARGAELVGEVA